MEINSSVNNAVLRELFDQRKEMKSETEVKELMNKVAEEIVMNARFLTPVRLSNPPVLNDDGTSTVPSDTKISFALLSAPDGKKYYPAFTSVDEVLKWDVMNEQKPMNAALGFDDYAEMIVDKNAAEGMVINPFSDNLIVGRQLAAHWKQKKQIRRSGHSETMINLNSDSVKIGAPEPFNMELSVALSTAAKNTSGVNALWFRGMILNGEKCYLAVIDYKGDRRAIFNSVGEAAKPYLGGMPLQIVALDEALGKTATEDVMPIFKA